MQRSLRFLAGLSILGALATTLTAGENESAEEKFGRRRAAYIEDRINEFDRIPDARKKDLNRLAAYVRSRIQDGSTAKLVFICTHNSRRSHMAQIWAASAASYYEVSGVECYSGGTEATALNPRAVAALERAGFDVEQVGSGKNPEYKLQIGDGAAPLVCFSKKYGDAPNPTSGFCAVMTCASADKACPTVEGSSMRIAIEYKDPKLADDTPQEAATYDERCAQISREMLYLFSRVGA